LVSSVSRTSVSELGVHFPTKKRQRSSTQRNAQRPTVLGLMLTRNRTWTRRPSKAASAAAFGKYRRRRAGLPKATRRTDIGE
jgi:hypothetical protein